jgi:peroxin-4
MSQFQKRLRKEVELYAESTDEFVQLKPVRPEDLASWTAVVRGPPESPYADFLFNVAIELPSEYPLVPPTMTFKTKIFHPNVHFATGEICIDILKKAWSPAWSLQSACRAITSILSEPVHDSPLNCDAGNMLRAGDLVAFRSMAKMYCVEFATALPPLRST